MNHIVLFVRILSLALHPQGDLYLIISRSSNNTQTHHDMNSATQMWKIIAYLIISADCALKHFVFHTKFFPKYFICQ